MNNSTAAPARSHLRKLVLGSTALSIGLLVSSVAMAAGPAAGSLPGNFSTNIAGTTYTGTGSTAAIAIGGSTAPGTASVIQFGGAALSTPVTSSDTSSTTGAALAAASNSGFSVGTGAALTITNKAAAFPTLINDDSGNPSQIYGSVDASALGGSLFVANANGVVVGAGGTITSPAGGLGLIGYAASSNAFATGGAIAVASTTKGTGDISIATGGVTGTGELLVAGNGAINVGVAPTAGVAVLSGYGFTATGGPASPITVAAGTAFSNSPSSVTFTGGSTTANTLVKTLYAAGNVTNAGITDFTAEVGPASGIGGTFSNTGVAKVAGLTAGSISNAGKLTDTGGTLKALGATGATSGADIINTGIIDNSSAALTLNAGQIGGNATGNVTNSGVIAFTGVAPNTLAVNASNINFGGSVQQAAAGGATPTALSATNALGGFTLAATYTDSTGKVVPGVVDYASTVYSTPFTLSGQAVRVLSGSLIDLTGGTSSINAGSGTTTDPFFSNAKLGYNLSIFPNAMVEGNGLALTAETVGAPTTYGDINLDGTVSTQVTTPTLHTSINVIAHNINAGSTGGFAVNDGDALNLAFTGNVNNPNGAANAGSTAFQYNFVPVTVGNTTSGKTGTVTLALTDGGAGALSGTSTTAQNVNILVNGNATLSNTLTVPATVSTLSTTTPISPAASYVNNHLVVQSTGNIQVGDGPGTFYWPGLVYLSNVTSAASPMAMSSAGSITLGNTSTPFVTNLNNIIPALVTGGAGVFFETNNLNLNTGTVSTNSNAWVNFASAKIASAFQLTQSNSFFGGYTDKVTSTVTELGLQALPAADYQPQ